MKQQEHPVEREGAVEGRIGAIFKAKAFDP